MDMDPADRNLVDLMLGYRVIVEYLAGPAIEDDVVLKRLKEGEVLTGQPQTRTAARYLYGYSSHGIEVKEEWEDPRSRFIPWGAVLAIHGQSRDELERNAREDAAQEQAEGTAPSPDRQEVMDLLANAETPSEAADAKAAADGWLLTHPSDGDVRMAREQLEDRFPDDAEEASPT